jgi:hypothetical protein
MIDVACIYSNIRAVTVSALPMHCMLVEVGHRRNPSCTQPAHNLHLHPLQVYWPRAHLQLCWRQPCKLWVALRKACVYVILQQATNQQMRKPCKLSTHLPR